ncbi:uncharacterized protein YodC (DUF2158 family) [Sphingomonas kyeonggiensis]|uniref:YodC family protein n=1 Tax=Sphingomonas kyeonggiensis TaxID=1268553 RepID=UPI002789E8D9|nr:DUF2158 domain-containing protein [Sphingomonas kyeonggiensis]MDQ0248093.1 uncharacterized protein YodC (DUF2158 family) [Sphingomonas kyeonggiensis]
MAEAEIGIGSTVQLKSGGPVMTVENIGQRSSGGPLHAWCQWFEKNKLETGVFPLTSLEFYS